MATKTAPSRSHPRNANLIMSMYFPEPKVEYSLWETSVETNGLLDTCKELGVALVAYSPLGRGMLAGKFKSPDDFEEGDTR